MPERLPSAPPPPEHSAASAAASAAATAAHALPLRVLIVDDEALARLRLRSLLSDEPGVTVAGEADNADAALRLLQRAGSEPDVDLLLLDIRMPGASARLSQHSGLHLAKALKAWPRPPAVVFVSAYAEHALAAFDLEAVDYLTKPVRRDRLQAALQRVRQRLQPVRDAQAAHLPPPAPALVITDRGRVLRLPVPELLYFKAEQKYVTLRTAGHSYVLDESLSELEQRLAELQPLGATAFIRVHRNALVGLHAIRSLEVRDAPALAAEGGDEASEGPEGWAVRVAPVDEWLAVSRRQVGAVRAALADSASRGNP